MTPTVNLRGRIVVYRQDDGHMTWKINLLTGHENRPRCDAVVKSLWGYATAATAILAARRTAKRLGVSVIEELMLD